MRYLVDFNLFLFENSASGLDTSWERNIDGEVKKITLKQVIDYLDSGQEMDPEELEPLLIKTKRDSERVESSDLEYPIIVLSSGGELKSILDGQHRVVKALDSGEMVKVRILDLDLAPEEFKSILGD